MVRLVRKRFSPQHHWQLATRLGDSMRVFLRSKQTGKYFGRDQDWTDNRSEAFDFTQIDQAITAAVQKRLGEVEVVLRFDQEGEIKLQIH